MFTKRATGIFRLHLVLSIFVLIVGCGGGGGGDDGGIKGGSDESFAERWESAAIAVHGPDIDDPSYSGIPADTGKWFIGDTVSEFPDDCGEPRNTASIISYNGGKALQLSAYKSLEGGGCSDNIWVDNDGLHIPINPDTDISFYEIGELVNPEPLPLSIFPPCNNATYLALIDNNGNELAYVLQYPEDYASYEDNSYYGEVFLTSADGQYSRNVYDDFQMIDNFIPSGSYIIGIMFEVDPNNNDSEDLLGWAIIDDIVISEE